MRARGWRRQPAQLRTIGRPPSCFGNSIIPRAGRLRAGPLLRERSRQRRRSVSAEEFDRKFTGVVLTLEPGPDFRPGGARPGVVRQLWPWLRDAMAPLSFAMACGLLMVVPGLALPLLLSLFVDQVLGGWESHWGFLPLAAAGAAGPCTCWRGYSSAVCGGCPYGCPSCRRTACYRTSCACRSATSCIVSPATWRRASSSSTRWPPSGPRSSSESPSSSSRARCSWPCCWPSIRARGRRRGRRGGGRGRDAGGVPATDRGEAADAARGRHDDGSRGHRAALDGVVQATAAEDDFFCRWTGYQARELTARQRFSELGHLNAAAPGFFMMLGGAAVIGSAAGASWRAR